MKKITDVKPIKFVEGDITKLGHDISKMIYEQLREQLEREGKALALAHYEELSKKYNGDQLLQEYLDELLHNGRYVKINEKDNSKNRQD